MKKVLVIEEEAPLWLIKKILPEDFEVVMLENGLDAWSWLSEGNTCDLIISDLKTPSVDYMELLENLRNSALLKDIPVIMLSGGHNSISNLVSPILG